MIIVDMLRSLCVEDFNLAVEILRGKGYSDERIWRFLQVVLGIFGVRQYFPDSGEMVIGRVEGNFRLGPSDKGSSKDMLDWSHEINIFTVLNEDIGALDSALIRDIL